MSLTEKSPNCIALLSLTAQAYQIHERACNSTGGGGRCSGRPTLTAEAREQLERLHELELFEHEDLELSRALSNRIDDDTRVQDDHRLRAQAPDLGRRPESVELRHLHLEECDIRARLDHGADRVSAVERASDDVEGGHHADHELQEVE